MSELAVGEVFAGHRLEAVAGRGGMGVVYRATQLSLERTVALKVIAPALMEDPAIRRRFVRESKVAASIDHPNVIPVYYAGEEDGVAYIAMRHVAGDDLRALVRREGRLAPERAANIVAQLGSALDAAHGAGLVHRDVKPANVLLGPHEHAYLTDFGLTKHVLSLADATQPGHWVGTLDFVAPEQIRGERVDARADVYALGCLLYFALSGGVPFQRDNQEAKLWAHLSEPPPRVSAAMPGIPEAFDAVIVRALSKDAEGRYPSAGDLGRAALAAAAGREVALRERNVAVGAAAPVEAETQTAATALDPRRAAAAPATVALPDATLRQPPVAEPPAPAAPPPRRRRPLVLAILGLLAAGVAAAVVLLPGALEDEPRAPAKPVLTAVPPVKTEVAATIRIGGRPNAIAIGGGHVWVARFGNPRLVAIDPDTDKVIPGLRPEVGIGTIDMTVGGGSLWVALARDRKLVRLDPRTGRKIGAPIELPMAAAAVTYLDGAPWVALDIGGDSQRGTVARIDPDSGQITASDTVRDSVVAIKAVRGSIWVLTGVSARLLELDPQARRRKTFKLRNGVAGGMAYGAGAFWVSLRDYDQVAKVDPATGNVATVAVGSGPAGVEVLGGRVWVANRASSSITQVSTRTLRLVDKPINVEINPVEMASTGDDIWVTSVGNSAVQRIRVGPAS